LPNLIQEKKPRPEMLMSDVIDKVRAESSNVGSDATPSAEVYAVYGVEPEILAYAMAKYSRSALSMKESLREISQQKAEKFLNTFYFQYGHLSQISRILRWQLNVFPYSRQSQSPTSSAGMVRNVPLVIRISRRADISFQNSAMPLQALPAGRERKNCIERP